MIIFLAKLNGMEIWAADVGNVDLEAKMSERVYIIGGPEFAEREGHVLVIYKALQTSQQWKKAQRFSDCLCEMGFIPSMVEPEIWMRHCGDKWEYIGMYIDDCTAALPDSKAIMDN